MRPRQPSWPVGIALALALVALVFAASPAVRRGASGPVPGEARASRASSPAERPSAPPHVAAVVEVVGEEPAPRNRARVDATDDASAIDPAALVRQRRESAAMARFAFVSLPAIDACLGPVIGPRRPQPFALQFRREPGQERFVAVAVQSVRPMRPTTIVARCVRTLLGRALELDDPALAGRSELGGVISLLVPADELAERFDRNPAQHPL